jgi:chromosome segregation ATPase
MSSGAVQIVVAMIGVAGSLGVAYVTTGATFDAKLRADSASVSELRDSVRNVTARLTDELRRAQSEISQINARLDGARQGVETVRGQIQALRLNPAVLQQLQKHP